MLASVGSGHLFRPLRKRCLLPGCLAGRLGLLPFGDLIALLVLFAAALGWAPAQLSWVCLALLIGWTGVVLVARQQYVDNLRESIRQHRLDSERASMPVLDRDTSALISSRLKGSPGEIQYALSLFEASNDRSIHPAVRGLLRAAMQRARACRRWQSCRE